MNEHLRAMQDTLKTKFDDATDDPVVDRYIRLPLGEWVLSLICIVLVSSAVSICRVHSLHRTARCAIRTLGRATARWLCWWLFGCVGGTVYLIPYCVCHTYSEDLHLYVVPFGLGAGGS